MGSINLFNSLAQYEAAALDKPSVSLITDSNSLIYDSIGLDDYDILPYLGFNSDQWTELNIQDGAGIGFEIKAMPKISTFSYRALVGNADNYIRFNGDHIHINMGGANVLDHTLGSSPVDSIFTIARYNDKKGYINGDSYELGVAGNVIGGNICLGAYNSETEGTKRFLGYVYYCNIYNYGELIAELIPVKRKSDDVTGFFDKMTGSFYTSLSGNPFVTSL